MSKPKRKVDYEEVEEIIALKLKDLGGIRKKLTYNSVFKFNENIANNEEFKRKNGELFNRYGYDFWAGQYNGVDYYGKQKIDEIKRNSNVQVLGEEFTPGIKDIIMLVNDLHSKPEVLTRKLRSIYEKDKKKIASLENEVEKLTKQTEKLNKDLRAFEKGFTTVFYNSILDSNSLPNVLSMKKSKDELIFDELKNMFSQDNARVSKVIKICNELENKDFNLIIMEEEKQRKRSRRKAYEDDL